MSLKHLHFKLSIMCPCVVKNALSHLFRQSTHKLLYVWEKEREALFLWLSKNTQLLGRIKIISRELRMSHVMLNSILK